MGQRGRYDSLLQGRRLFFRGVTPFQRRSVADLDDDFTNADLKVSVTVRNQTVAAVDNVKVGVQLFDATGTSVLSYGVLTHDDPLSVASGKKASVSLSQTVKKPYLWSGEDPYLYTLVLTEGANCGILIQIF